MEGFHFCSDIDVRYADIDMMGHVNNAKYLTYIEHARGAYFRESCQWDWKKWGMVLARTEIDYRQQIELGHRPMIWIRTTKLGRTSFTQHYIITDKKDSSKLFAEATSILVHVSYETRRPEAIPAIIRERLIAYEEVLK